ncbi:MAG: hypothetical protein QF827_05890 [Alphaproteobacteria bacterium]|nr:hypothetical protein [Alphaproteobacteria bacterium]
MTGTTFNNLDGTQTLGVVTGADTSTIDLSIGFTSGDTLDFQVNSNPFTATSSNGNLNTFDGEVETASGNTVTAIRVDSGDVPSPTGTFLRLTAVTGGQAVDNLVYTDVDAAPVATAGTDTAAAAGFSVVDLSTNFNTGDKVLFDVDGTSFTAVSSNGDLDTFVTEIGTASGSTATAIRVNSSNVADAAGTFVRITADTLGQNVNNVSFLDVDNSTSGTFGTIEGVGFFASSGPTYSGTAFTGSVYANDTFSGDYDTEFAKAGADATDQAAFLDNLFVLSPEGNSVSVTQGFSDLINGKPVVAATAYQAGTSTTDPFRLEVNIDIYA